MADPVVTLQRNLYGHPCGRIVMGEAIRESSFGKRMGNVSNWECFFVHREKGLFLSVYVDDIKLAGNKRNLDPMWKVPMKGVSISQLHMRYIQWSTHLSTHVEHERTERKTPRLHPAHTQGLPLL